MHWPLANLQSKRADQKIEHRVPHLAVVRPKRELPKIPIKVLLSDMDMCSGDGRLEQVPERLRAISREARPRLMVRPSPFLARVVNRAVNTAVTL